MNLKLAKYVKKRIRTYMMHIIIYVKNFVLVRIKM
ncbi:hypothetical protein HMPREF0981_01294 [Erysipelotrichaceae bacterium 6_1_45]|nr:hypothetical protein HMPREF0981_01294 [Erysipelotrichaceae bacterium 6_1_45]